MVEAQSTSTSTSGGGPPPSISRYESFVQSIPNRILVIVPLLLPSYLLLSHIIWLNHQQQQQHQHVMKMMGYLVIAGVGYITTRQLIPHIAQYTLRKNIYGKDLGKRGTPTQNVPIPEALGIVPGAVFLVCLITCLVGFNAKVVTTTPTFDVRNMTHILEINTSLLAICFMLFLGFTDDVLDWPWRYKLILPTIASLPILTCYTGSTIVVVPKQLRGLLWNTTRSSVTVFGRLIQSLLGLQIDPYRTQTGSLLDLQYIYFIYMSMLAVFCTNAINIYAGINGLEVGQSFIIASAILIYNCIEIRLLQQQQQQSLLDTSGDEDRYHMMTTDIDHHVFSIMVMVCFLGVTLGLLVHNWYPARVFVGDTYCYFAGMTFAVVGILGHFSKTLLLFFIPQILNFLWSTPQLFHFVPCPRHRLPTFQSTTGLMTPSTFVCKPHEYQWLKRWGGQPVRDTVGVNMTLINVCLQVCGPLSERTLCITLLLLQIVCCGIGLGLRYYVSKFFF